MMVIKQIRSVKKIFPRYLYLTNLTRKQMHIEKHVAHDLFFSLGILLLKKSNVQSKKKKPTRRTNSEYRAPVASERRVATIDLRTIRGPAIILSPAAFSPTIGKRRFSFSSLFLRAPSGA